MEGKMIQSPQGDISSKRVAGLSLAGLAIVSMIVGAFTQNALLVDVGETFLYAGGGLLGIGVFEHLRR